MSKQALISPNEPRESGYRVAQVVPDGQTFNVGEPLFWTPCADNIAQDQWWYNPTNDSFLPLPANIISITFVGTTANVTTFTPHNLTNGTSVTLSMQTPSNYSGTYNIVVDNGYTFSYTMATTPTENADDVGVYNINNQNQNTLGVKNASNS